MTERCVADVTPEGFKAKLDLLPFTIKQTAPVAAGEPWVEGKNFEKITRFRRTAFVTISEHLLLEMLQGRRSGPGMLILPGNVAVPADATVLDVRRDGFRGTLDVLLASESFAPVLEGDASPRIEPTFRSVTRTCGNCQHWTAPKEGLVKGECDRIDDVTQTEQASRLTPSDYSYEGVFPACPPRDFGCNRFELREGV